MRNSSGIGSRLVTETGGVRWKNRCGVPTNILEASSVLPDLDAGGGAVAVVSVDGPGWFFRI
jgi:hypothetical protein